MSLLHCGRLRAGPIAHPASDARVSMKQWSDTDKGKPKNSARNLFQSYFAHHKSHLDSLGSEPGPLLWEDSELPALIHSLSLLREDYKYKTNVHYWHGAMIYGK